MDLKNEIVELYKKAATELPSDIVLALEKAEKEEQSPTAKEILATILENVDKAKTESKPICQDTGIPLFYVKRSANYSEHEIKKFIWIASSIILF